MQIYTDELVKLHNPEALHRACQRIAVTWEEARRPPLRAIINQYHSEAIRLERPALPSSDPVIPPRQGVEVACDAYRKECRRNGTKPNMEFFDRTMAGIIERVTVT